MVKFHAKILLNPPLKIQTHKNKTNRRISNSIAIKHNPITPNLKIIKPNPLNYNPITETMADQI